MKNFLDWLFGREKVQFMGILDTTPSKGVNIVEFKEAVASAAAPFWESKPTEMWRTFLPQYQKTSSACVAFTVAKIAQILFWLREKRKIKFSPGWIYRQRTPKGEGMWIDNAIVLASKGIPTEELYPSENMTEVEINSLPDYPYGGGVAEEFAISPNWVELPLDFDTVASTIQKTGKGIMLWFRFGVGEWFRNRTPKVLKVSRPYKHSVTAVDAFIYNGVQYLLIEDSAESNITQRLITRQAFDSMCWLARYPLSFKFDQQTGEKLKYDGSVVSLQDCLKYGGFMAANIPSTGYFGKITVEALKKFQFEYGIEQTGTLDPKTTSKLKEIYPYP